MRLLRGRAELRLISAKEAMLAAEEAEKCGSGAESRALRRNACLLARAVYCGGKRVFSDGREVLRRLPAETIACWTGSYGLLCQSQSMDPDALREALAGDPVERLRWRVMEKLGPEAMRFSARELLYCVLQMQVDGEEALARFCPQCRQTILEPRCPVCGAVQYGENPNFDEKRFEELKQGGLSDTAPADAGAGDITDGRRVPPTRADGTDAADADRFAEDPADGAGGGLSARKNCGENADRTRGEGI